MGFHQWFVILTPPREAGGRVHLFMEIEISQALSDSGQVQTVLVSTSVKLSSSQLKQPTGHWWKSNGSSQRSLPNTPLTNCFLFNWSFSSMQILYFESIRKHRSLRSVFSHFEMGQNCLNSWKANLIYWETRPIKWIFIRFKRFPVIWCCSLSDLAAVWSDFFFFFFWSMSNINNKFFPGYQRNMTVPHERRQKSHAVGLNLIIFIILFYSMMLTKHPWINRINPLKKGKLCAWIDFVSFLVEIHQTG